MSTSGEQRTSKAYCENVAVGSGSMTIRISSRSHWNCSLEFVLAAGKAKLGTRLRGGGRWVLWTSCCCCCILLNLEWICLFTIINGGTE